ncbi:MAG: OsmC family protein [Gammaproteobacteria bacterium]
MVVGDAHRPPYFQEIVCGRHALVSDQSTERGGLDAGPDPFAYLLSGLGACTSISLRMYAERKRWSIGTVMVTLELFGTPGAWEIRRGVQLLGELSEFRRQRLAELCERTPITLVLKEGLSVKTTFAVSPPV